MEGERLASPQAAVDEQREEWCVAAAFCSRQKRAHLVGCHVGSVVVVHLGRRTACAGLCAIALSRTAISSTARKIAYAVRIEGSACPRSFSSTFHASMWDGRQSAQNGSRADFVELPNVGAKLLIKARSRST